jgi:hypothetical protein
LSGTAGHLFPEKDAVPDRDGRNDPTSVRVGLGKPIGNYAGISSALVAIATRFVTELKGLGKASSRSMRRRK